MNITKYVEGALEGATIEQLRNIIANGVDIPDGDMREALENAYVEVAQEKLKLLGAA
jgi:hypothetical protein